MSKVHTAPADQNGFVSIVVCMIIMTILTLITIGFARIMNNEQRQALDRQLSTQAFYAAESGVNDARLKIAEDPAYPLTNNCVPYDIGTDGSTKNTCLRVEREVESILNDIPPDPNNPGVMTIRAVDSLGNIVRVPHLNISWTQYDNTSTAPNDFRLDAAGSVPELPSLSEWKNTTRTGMIKITLIPFKNGDSRDTLAARTVTLFLVPEASGVSTVNYTNYMGIESNGLIPVQCDNADKTCTLRIDNILAATAAPDYDVLRLVISSEYVSNRVSVRSDNLRFRDVQAIIDSNGKVGDVLRRIQVRVPLETTSRDIVANVAQTADDICKKLRVTEAKTEDFICGSITGGPGTPTPLPEGDSKFTSNPCNDPLLNDLCKGKGGGGGGGGGGNALYWGANFTITSQNLPGTMSGCVWKFTGPDDYSKVVNKGPADCEYGDDQFNGFPQSDPVVCKVYNIELTINFYSSPAKVFPSTRRIPRGPGSPC